ncbi:hypothetical protein Bca101_097751 [Brassica carinata]
MPRVIILPLFSWVGLPQINSTKTVVVVLTKWRCVYSYSKKVGELMGLTCSLSRRRQSTLIHRLQMFRDRFSEGSLYSMSGFDEVTTTSKFECAADRDVFICLTSPTNFIKKFTGFNGELRVVVATYRNPKMVGYLQTQPLRRIYAFTHKHMQKGQSYYGRNLKLETVSQPNEFIITAAPQTIDFVCTGKVTGIQADKRWCYIGSALSALKKLLRG